MERTKKGVSLVEVIVAIAVFSVISLTLFSAVIGLKSVVDRQEEYVKLEMICYDISAYHTKQTNELPWYKSYFGSGIISRPRLRWIGCSTKPQSIMLIGVRVIGRLPAQSVGLWVSRTRKF